MAGIAELIMQEMFGKAYTELLPKMTKVHG